jgi:hypothetical protein
LSLRPVEQKEQKTSGFGFSLRDLASRAGAAIILFLPKPGKKNLPLLDKGIDRASELMKPETLTDLNKANHARYKGGTKLKKNGGLRQARAEVRRNLTALIIGLLPYANITPQGAIPCGIPDEDGFLEGLGLAAIAERAGLSYHCILVSYVLACWLGLIEMRTVKEAIKLVNGKIRFRAHNGIPFIKKKLFKVLGIGRDLERYLKSLQPNRGPNKQQREIKLREGRRLGTSRVGSFIESLSKNFINNPSQAPPSPPVEVKPPRPPPDLLMIEEQRQKAAVIREALQAGMDPKEVMEMVSKK